MFPTLKQLTSAGRTLGLKGGAKAVEYKAGIHSPAYKKKRKAAKKATAPKKAAGRKAPATKRKATRKKKR